MDVVRAIMLAWFLAHGYAPHQAEAIIHSAWIETRLQPCRVGRSGAYLFQWAGKRLTALRAYAGPRCPSLETQLAFADAELRHAVDWRGRPLYAAFWRQRTEDGAYRVFRCSFEAGWRRC